MLDRLTEAEENFRSGAANGIQIMVSENEIVIFRISLVGIEIREYRVNITRMRSARNAVNRVMRTSKRNACGLVIFKISAHLIATRLLHRRAVIYGVHQLYRS